MEENTQNIETTSIAPEPGVPDPGQVPASPAASEVVDPSVSLNQRLAALEAENANILRGMNQAQREAAEAKKRLREVAPILEYSERDRNFMPYIYEKAREYGPEGSVQQLDPAVLGALNPIQQEVRQLREQVEEKAFHEQMNKLSVDFPEIMTAQAKQQLANDAYATGDYDLERHFYKNYGPQLMALARQQGTKEAVKTIQANNQLYATGATTTAVAPPVNVKDMTEAEKKAWLEQDIDKIWSDPDYAAKVARELQG